MKIRFVCATRFDAEQFAAQSPLGRSLAAFRSQYGHLFEIRLYPGNRHGLSAVYNHAIEEARDASVLLAFVHDDVWLTDCFWPQRFAEACGHFDLVGVAGNRRRVPRQISWAFVEGESGPLWDAREHLSGCVAHGPRSGQPDIDRVGYYGPARVEVKLLDGVLLLCPSQTLANRGLRFDERFDFHFYDLDFCRQAESLGMRMGTWDISLIHCSEGNFGDPRWLKNYEQYLAKWES